ncbi:unnamed protein product, partial [Leptidea sinapis]
MCMPTPTNVSGFAYSWGFTSSADLTKCEVDTPGSLSYTLGNTVSPETTLTVMSHKSPQVQEKVGTVTVASNSAAQVTRVVTTGTPGGGRRAMFVLNESPTQTINRVSQQNQTTSIQSASNLASKPFMTPLGPIQLTAEECNEILMKRALQAQGIATPVIDASQLNHTLLNGAIKSLAEVTTQQNQTETIQTTPVHQHHLLHTKQEPGTTNNSPKTVQMQPQQQAPVKERPYSCDEPHVCGHCGKAFARKHCLNTHLLLHSADRPYRCHECKMAFTLKHHLVTHSRVHSRDRPFICGECGRGFPLKRHLVTHTKYHAGERPYVCNECGESFAQKEHLVMHSRFHGSLSPFVCPDCGLAFARKFQLVNHGRVHGRVPHACPVCGKEFLQKRTLVAHLKIHTGEGTVACFECGEAFKDQPIQIISSNQPNNVNPPRHAVALPRPKLHFCVDCGKGFSAKHGLLAHHRRNPEGSCTLRTHVCDNCGKAFYQKNHLMLHQRQHMDLPSRNVTNRSGQVIGNQIMVGSRRLLPSQLHIVSRDGKPLHHITKRE